ncbi:MAG: hypothetical protein L3J30_12300 [Marinosulfonomonas sp.]|nr:hypothetical protein [Marinosulfonomonas sp.]
MEKSRYGWSAASPDTFVMLYSRDGNFYANTFGGYIFKIDIETGKTFYHGFGK